jgi:hypothetical protein
VLGPGGDIIIARCLTVAPIKPLAGQTAAVMHQHDLSCRLLSSVTGTTWPGLSSDESIHHCLHNLDRMAGCLSYHTMGMLPEATLPTAPRTDGSVPCFPMTF